MHREGAAAAKSPLDLAALRRGLEGTAHFIATAPPFWAAVSDYWAGYSVNQIVPQEEADSKTDITVPSGHRFACGWYELEPDQALVVEFAPASVPYWGLGLTNYWYEAIGWAEGGSGINDQSAHYERDGTVRVLIGDRPDTLRSDLNWLDTRGHRQGTMVFRWSRSALPLPVFESRVVKLAELAGIG